MKRFLSILAWCAPMAAVMIIVFHFARAYAATLAPSPLDAGGVVVVSGMDLITQYGWLWGTIALVYGGVAYLLKQNESKHWIAQGRNLSIVVGAFGVIGAALQAHFAGTAWSGVLLTAIMAAFKLINPMVLAPALVMIFAFASSIGCGAAQKAAEKQLLACSENAAWNDLKPTVESILASGVSNWKAQLSALALAFGENEIACAVVAAQTAFAHAVGGDTMAGDAMARAAEYLAEHNVTTK